MALFYRQEIELLNKKESLIKELNKSKELVTNYSTNKNIIIEPEKRTKSIG